MKKKCGRTPSMIFLIPAFFFALSCSSLPSLPDAEIPAEVVVIPDEPADPADNEVLFLPETVIDEEPAADETPDAWGRAEETLAYLDTPVNPDLPEPGYVIPEPEPVAATEPPPNEIEPAAEVAVETEDDVSEPPEDVATEEIVVEASPPVPPPPALLRPVRETAAALPPREPLSMPPGSLPMQPARIPPNETKRQDDTPSRTIQAVLGENAEVPLPGSGWVYLGEADSQSGLAYRQRRVSADGQTFVFRPENIGSYRLKFRKQDLIRGTETSEIVEVAVIEKNTSDKSTIGPTIAVTDTPIADAETAPPDSPPDPSAIALAIADTNDTALWNRGQELEAPGPNRDIKGALTAYKTLVRDYPQSEYYTGSQKRIAYIERYFVNIR